MNGSEILNRLTSKALQKSMGFALWYLPGQDQINAIVDEQGSLMQSNLLTLPESQHGFVFSPFVSNNRHQTIFLQADSYLKGFDEIENYVVDFHQNDNSIDFVIAGNEAATNFEDYLSACNSIIHRIKNGEVDKVVFSRIKVISRASDKTPTDLLLSLKVKYPDAFCYLFYTPQSGLWMGASPETLAHKQGACIKTMALAGTRKHQAEALQDLPWPEKEIVEQQFVSDFIIKELKNLGLNDVEISAPHTSIAGSIEHIQTDFVINNQKDQVSMGAFVKALHPTPAVCGQPKEEALKIIEESEKHHRAYYAGFLGPMNMSGTSNLFVNLRCGKMMGTNFALYVGGGITADSDAEKEWYETELKARILEEVLA